jgi:hypothetical protein
MYLLEYPIPSAHPVTGSLNGMRQAGGSLCGWKTSEDDID